MKSRKTVFIVCLFLGVCIVPYSHAAPEWVSSMGTRTRFPDDGYITGFAQAERSGDDTGSDAESLETVKTRALDDLIRKIKVQVKSSITTETEETAERSASSISIVSRSVSDLQLSKADFLIEQDYRSYYALTYEAFPASTW